MGWPKLLILVRHAESEGNIMTRQQKIVTPIPGHEYKLSKRGEKQAKITGDFLRQTFGIFDIYYASYYPRAQQTMRIMYPQIDIREDFRLAEAQRGIWDVMDEKYARKHIPWELKRKERDGLYHYRPIGGESWTDVELRIHSFLGTLARDCEGLKVLVVVHGQWFISFQKLIEHFSIEEALRRRKSGVIENASVNIYEGWIVLEKPKLVLIKQNFVPWKGKL